MMHPSFDWVQNTCNRNFVQSISDTRVFLLRRLRSALEVKVASLSEGAIMAEKSPQKNTAKTPSTKSLKEKRLEKKTKSAAKSKGRDE